MQTYRMKSVVGGKHARQRRGSAPLEFVMAMPLLLLLFALILSVGVFSLGNVKATVAARSDAFKQRTNHKSQLPLTFNQKTSKGDVFSVSATETPAYPSPKFNFGPITRSHAVLGGSWDHRELLRGNGPHWGDMGKASIGGGTNQIASLLDKFSNGFDPSSLPGLDDVAGGLIGQLLGQSQDANNQFDQLGKEAEEQTKKNIEKLQKEADELQMQKDALQKKIDDELTPKADQLDSEIAERAKKILDEKDPAKKKQLEEEQKQAKDEVKAVRDEITQHQKQIDLLTKQIDAKRGLADRL
jgi:hypothetical protein